jgi:hypothetical protein
MAGNPIAIPATFVLRAGSGQVAYRYLGETMFDRPAVRAILAAVDQAQAPAAHATPSPAP